MSTKVLFAAWLLVLIATALGCAICIHWVDFPVALLFQRHARQLSGLGRGLSSSILVMAEMVLIASLSLIRLVRGSLPEYGKALFIATSVSLSSFSANDYILKVIFGRQNPSAFLLKPTVRVFYFMQGDDHSSFPSGHMVMATAFAVVLIRLYPRTLPVLVTLLCVGAIALLVGDWHFVSDVIAGTFVGGTAGIVSGELWDQHTRRWRAPV
jgi:membrane-associated phospholipid phosphatase